MRPHLLVTLPSLSKIAGPRQTKVVLHQPILHNCLISFDDDCIKDPDILPVLYFDLGKRAVVLLYGQLIIPDFYYIPLYRRGSARNQRQRNSKE